jgi:hypothetical protein
MNNKGWLRLWVVLTVIGVPVAAELDFQQKERFWTDLNAVAIKNCVDVEYSSPAHPDALECGRQQGTMKTVFQREGTTPLKYWSSTMGVFFIADLVLAAILAALLAAALWVVRGFRRTSTP